MITRFFFFIGLFFCRLFAEPVPFVNPHPLSDAHMNPIMDGKNERIDISYMHSSFYEDTMVQRDGQNYNRVIDFESSELSILLKKRYKGYSITLNGSVVYNYAGYLDDAIIYVHDRTGSTGGRWRKKKEAPRNKYRFFVKDENGNEVVSAEKVWQNKAEVFIAKEIGYDFLLRAGTRVPMKKGSSFISATDYEYSLTLQKGLEFYDIELLADISAVWLSQDKTGLPLKDKRTTSNFYLSYDDSFFIQTNVSESVFLKTGDRVLDQYGAIYIVGYKKNNWFIGFVEDYTLYNNPDVSVMGGITFKKD
ncbi:MAG: hypothetical protein QG567_767 [Campylobacterota bacterium]|nr:hypothetical protein [Campylobacterota bacterium]